MIEVLKSDRFTLLNCDEVEIVMNSILGTLNSFFLQHSTSLDLVLMIGGYGKGEGGVVERHGHYSLKNNIDLLIFPSITASISFYKGLSKLKEKISNQYDILIDLSYMELDWLENSNSLMAFDLKVGHYIIYKSDLLDISKYLKPFNVNDVPIDEFTSLLVNRGVLLLLNDNILKNNSASSNKKVMVHISKAIIGLGDFLLAVEDNYSWSYCEKNKRIKVLNRNYSELIEYYELAYRYRSFDDHSLFENNSNLVEINNKIKLLYKQVISIVFKDKTIFKSSREVRFKTVFKSVIKLKKYRNFLLSNRRGKELFICEPNEVIRNEVLSCFLEEHPDQNQIIEIWASVNDPNFINHITLENK